MTTTGENRARYAEQVPSDPAPSRFDAEYSDWAARADRWARSNRYAVARRVVDTCTAGKLEGQLLDLFTASALVAVFEALSPESQAKFDTLPLARLVDFAFKQVAG